MLILVFYLKYICKASLFLWFPRPQLNHDASECNCIYCFLELLNLFSASVRAIIRASYSWSKTYFPAWGWADEIFHNTDCYLTLQPLLNYFSSALSPTNWDNFGPPWPNTPEKGSWDGWLCGPIGHSPLIFHLYKISIYISLEFNLIGMPPHRVQSGKVIITDHL